MSEKTNLGSLGTSPPPLGHFSINDDVILKTSSLVHGVKNSESGSESDDKICSSTVVSDGGILLANDGPMLVKNHWTY